MKGAAELAELRPKGRQTRNDCIAEKGGAKALSFRKRGTARTARQTRTEKLNVFARLEGHRADAIEFSRSLWGAMTNEMILVGIRQKFVKKEPMSYPSSLSMRERVKFECSCFASEYGCCNSMD